MVTLSVIIPMYNASKYIDDAIKSILSQQNITLELIIIDDGSTDNSVKQLKKYNNNIIKIYSKENGGAASARNFGLKKATGKYIMFLDSDDYISNKNICCECINIMESQSLDILIFSFKYYNQISNKYTIPYNYSQFATTTSNKTDLFIELISHGIFPASPCFRIIRRNYLIENNITFREGYIAEDIDWFIKTIINTSKIKVINDHSYIYRKAVYASVTNQTTLLKCNDLFTAIKESISLINNCDNLQLKKSLYSAIAYEYCILISNIYSINKLDILQDELKTFDYLLKYKLFPKIKYINLLYNILGLRSTAKLLNIYRKKLAKSHKN